jgi:hypothetical protein
MARDQLRLKEWNLSVTSAKDCILHPYLLLLLLRGMILGHVSDKLKMTLRELVHGLDAAAGEKHVALENGLVLRLLLDRLQVSVKPHALKSVKDWTEVLWRQLLIASDLLQLLRAKIALRFWLNLTNRTEEGDLAVVKIRRRLLCHLL